MTKIITKTYADYRAYMTNIILSICAILAFTYAVNIYNIIDRAVAIQDIATETKAVMSSIEALDVQYLKLTNSIDEETVREYGMRSNTTAMFIPRTSSLGRVALSGYEL